MLESTITSTAFFFVGEGYFRIFEIIKELVRLYRETIEEILESQRHGFQVTADLAAFHLARSRINRDVNAATAHGNRCGIRCTVENWIVGEIYIIFCCQYVFLGILSFDIQKIGRASCRERV